MQSGGISVGYGAPPTVHAYGQGPGGPPGGYGQAPGGYGQPPGGYGQAPGGQPPGGYGPPGGAFPPPPPRRPSGLLGNLSPLQTMLVVGGGLFLMGMASCLVCVGGSSDDDAAVADQDVPEVPPPAYAPPPQAPPQAPQQLGPTQEQEALAFFQSAVAACPQAASRGPGSQVIETRPGSIFKIQDGAGRHMLVHLSARLVYGPGGPNGEVPRPYTWCRHDVFVGTMDE